MSSQSPPGRALAPLALALLAGSARADLRAGSLLIFPEFDNRTAANTLLTVTNLNRGFGVDVEFVYVSRQGAGGNDLPCLMTTRTERLTASDTFTALTSFHMPRQELGYVYAFAKSPMTGQAISWNFLVGSQIATDGLTMLGWSANAFTFQSTVATGTPSDLDSDGVRDLDGNEYEPGPDRLYLPRFWGQDGSALALSDIILINLTGGTEFDARIEFRVVNDNEQVFTRERVFRCWERVPLLDVSGLFLEAFLRNATDHDPSEPVGLPQNEMGWFALNGKNATSSTTSIVDPMVLALLIETGALSTAVAPFVEGTQNNGDLLPTSPFGDFP